jgi:hypothetical protein
MGFDIIDGLMISVFTYFGYWRRRWSTMREYISYSETSRWPRVLGTYENI